jgi:folylpolyglutamate synthase/dihydropteroate synthase
LLQYWAQKDIIRDSIHSPHLSDYTERIQVDAARIPREDICKGH